MLIRDSRGAAGSAWLVWHVDLLGLESGNAQVVTGFLVGSVVARGVLPFAGSLLTTFLKRLVREVREVLGL